MRPPSGSESARRKVGSHFWKAASTSSSGYSRVAVNENIAFPNVSSRKLNVATARPNASQNVGECNCVGKFAGRLLTSTPDLFTYCSSCNQLLRISLIIRVFHTHWRVDETSRDIQLSGFQIILSRSPSIKLAKVRHCSR